VYHRHHDESEARMKKLLLVLAAARIAYRRRDAAEPAPATNLKEAA
jgi:hypothetical protein